MEDNFSSISHKLSTQKPILYFFTKSAMAALDQTITGKHDDIYSDSLCGLLYFVYSPKLPEQVSAYSPSHMNPKLPSSLAGISSGVNEPLYTI